MSTASAHRFPDSSRRRARSRPSSEHSSTPSRVGVTLLDGFEARVGGVPVGDAWRLKKARELIKLLALAPRHRLHREQLMDVLWSDRAPAAAANNLHQAVHAARRALEPHAIAVHDEMVQLIADVDVDRFEHAAAEARQNRTAGAYQAALSLYRGELLPENRYDDWASDRRDELGRLAEELEAELAGLAPAQPSLIRTVPAAISSFVGREGELAELTAVVARTRLLTLAGVGGIGKTRLALELARTIQPAYTSGVVLVELAALTDPALVPDAIAAALDIRALTGQSSLDSVVEYLSPRSLLLVLDNCEHWLGAVSDIVNTVLRAAPGVAILTTSREPLRVPGEIVFRVPSLDIPDPDRSLSPDQLLGYEAVRLFVERARAASRDFVLDEENAVDVARICVRLDGLPLALELAAGRIGALGAAAIAARLDDRFRVLRSSSHVVPSRQHTLSATLQWSHDLLERGEQILFRRLAAFSDGFTLDAVEDVCAWGDVAVGDVANVLGRLVEKSLVAGDERPSPHPRYRLLETVRLYARSQLDHAGEGSTLADRHGAWALELAERHRGSQRLDRDAANLRAAHDVLSQSSPIEALRLAVAMLPFWLRRIELREAQERFEGCLAAAPARTALRCDALIAAAAIDLRAGMVARGLARVEDAHAVALEIGDARAECRALQFLGEYGLAADAAEFAIPRLMRALDIARREHLAAAEATCVYSLGIAHWMLGDLDRAEALVAQSIESFESLAGAPEGIPSLINFAETTRAAVRGQLRIVFEDTLLPSVEISCDAALGYALANHAGIARARGDIARARVLLDDSEAHFVNLDDEAGQAAALVRRAYLELAEGALPAARNALNRALALRRRQEDRRGSGLVLVGLGMIETAAGEYRSGERHLEEARETFRCAGDRWGLASTLWRVAELALARHSPDDAEAALREARAVLAPTRRDRWIASTLVGLADVALLRCDVDRATVMLADARDRYAAREDAAGVAYAQQRLRELAAASL
jgi:predicted ATPase